MKRLHRPDLFGWSVFDESRNIDFHGLFWRRDAGNVMVDPLPLSTHDAAHVDELGGVALVIVTNSDHVRDAESVRKRWGASVAGPAAEKGSFPIACDRWLSEDDEPVAGLRVLELDGSKTPGELALLIDGGTLVTGDLVRAHEGGRLTMLPDAKLSDRQRALESVRRLAALESIDAVVPGDGWPVFRGGRDALRAIVD